jgi:hypothetical protein
MNEKRIEVLPQVRVTDTLLAHLRRLAESDDRTTSDYIRRVLENHVFGHGYTMPNPRPEGEEKRASKCKE